MKEVPLKYLRKMLWDSRRYESYNGRIREDFPEEVFLCKTLRREKNI